LIIMVKKIWHAFLESHNLWLSPTLGAYMCFCIGLFCWVYFRDIIAIIIFFSVAIILFSLGIVIGNWNLLKNKSIKIDL